MQSFSQDAANVDQSKAVVQDDVQVQEKSGEEKEKAEDEKEEEKEEEEEQVFEYNYEEMKSTPVTANVATSQMLTLQYPCSWE